MIFLGWVSRDFLKRKHNAGLENNNLYNDLSGHGAFGVCLSTLSHDYPFDDYSEYQVPITDYRFRSTDDSSDYKYRLPE